MIKILQILLTSKDEELKKKLSGVPLEQIALPVAAPLSSLSLSKKSAEPTSQVALQSEVCIPLSI